MSRSWRERVREELNERSHASNTSDSYKITLAAFEGWRRATPDAPKNDADAAMCYLHARAKGAPAFADYDGEIRQLPPFGCVSTLRSKITGLRHAGILPPAGGEQRREERGLAKIVQEREAPQRKQAVPLRAPDLWKILQAAAPSPALLRARAFCALAWLSLARMDEIRKTQCNDLLLSYARLTLRQGKTIGAGAARHIDLRYAERYPSLLPLARASLRAVGEWQAAREKLTPPDAAHPHLFVCARTDARNYGLVIGETTAIKDIRAVAAAAGIAGNGDHISGHSMRHGGAQDLHAAGAPLGDIMRQGGWRSQAHLPSYLLQPPPPLAPPQMQGGAA